MDKQETSKDAGMNSTAESNRPGLSNAEREAFEAAHKEAIENQTADSYLLGYLPEAELDAFEEHYFDCRVCADTVRAGADMFAAGREVAKRKKSEPPVPWFKERFQRPMTWAMAASFAVVFGYQGVIIPRIRALARPPVIEALVPTPLVTASTRGSNDDQVIRFHGKPVVLYRDIPPERPFPLYVFEIRAASGKVLGATNVSEEQARSGDSIPLSVHPLPVGRYVLAIVGVRKDGNRSEVVRWSVVVR